MESVKTSSLKTFFPQIEGEQQEAFLKEQLGIQGNASTNTTLKQVTCLALDCFGATTLTASNRDERSKEVVKIDLCSTISAGGGYTSKLVGIAFKSTLSKVGEKAAILGGKILAGIGWIFALFSSLFKLAEVSSFEDKINNYLRLEGEEGYIKALKWLQDQIFLTEIEKEGLSEEEKIIKIQKKISYFIERIGKKAFVEVALKEKKAKEVVQTVQQEIHRKKKIHLTCVFAAILGLAALVVLHFFTFGLSTIVTALIACAPIGIYLAPLVKDYLEEKKEASKIQERFFSEKETVA